MNFKKTVIIALAAVTFSCQDNDDGVLSSQQLYDIEKIGIEEFLNSNYYDKDGGDDVFKLIADTGNTSLREDTTITLKSTETTINSVVYTIYSIVTKEGVGVKGEDNTVDNNDKVNVKQTLLTLNESVISLAKGSVSLNKSFEFIDLNGKTDGLSVSLPFFKGGTFTENPEKPTNYENGGEGYVIIPFGAQVTDIIKGFETRLTVLYKINLRTVTKVANTQE